MKKNMVSIIVPAYNCDRFISETINSVREQTYKNWEMIIVDDFSTDNTRNIIEKYAEKDERIKHIFLDKNTGTANARNRAMQVAEGEYMAFLDSDDLWMPDKLEIQVNFMKKNDVAISCTAYEWIDEDSNSLHRVIKTIPCTDYKRLLRDCPVGNSTVIYSVEKLGKFEVPNIQKRNDYALWLKMTKKEKYIYGIENVLMQYRVVKNSVSRNKLKVVKYQWRIYRDIEHLSIFQCIWHIGFYAVIKILRIK